MTRSSGRSRSAVSPRRCRCSTACGPAHSRSRDAGATRAPHSGRAFGRLADAGAQHDIALALAQLLASGCEGCGDDAVAWAAERDELWARLGMAPAGPSETYSADSLRRRSAQTSSAG